MTTLAEDNKIFTHKERIFLCVAYNQVMENANKIEGGKDFTHIENMLAGYKKNNPTKSVDTKLFGKILEECRNRVSHIKHKTIKDMDDYEHLTHFLKYHYDLMGKPKDLCLVNDDGLTKFGYLFILSFAVPKSTLYPLLDVFKIDREYKTAFVQNSRRDGYNANRQKKVVTDPTHWTVFSSIIDYLQKPIQGTQKALEFAEQREETTKAIEKTTYNIRTQNKFMFDVFFFQWIQVNEQVNEQVKEYIKNIEFARSIATYCDIKKKWIPRPYFDTENKVGVLKKLNEFRRENSFLAQGVEVSDVAFEDCEYYRDAGHCYCIKFKDNIIRLHRNHLKSFVKILMEDRGCLIEKKLNDFFTFVKGTKDKKDTKKYDSSLPNCLKARNPKNFNEEIFFENHESRFKATDIHKKSIDGQIHFILWALQHPVAYESGVKDSSYALLNHKQYNELFMKILSNQDNVILEIKDFLKAHNICPELNKSVGLYMKKSLSKTISEICKKAKKNIKEYKETKNANGLKSCGIKPLNQTQTSNNSAIFMDFPKQNETYAKPLRLMVPKQFFFDKEEKGVFLESIKQDAEKKLGKLWENNYFDSGKGFDDFKNKKITDKKDIKDFIANRSQFHEDILLLSMASVCVQQQESKFFKISPAPNATIADIVFKIEDIPEAIPVKHIGKVYFQYEEGRFKSILKGAKEIQSREKKPFIACMMEFVQHEKRGWYNLGEKIFEIEDKILSGMALGERSRIDFYKVIEILVKDYPRFNEEFNEEKENDKVIKSIRNGCCHFRMFESTGQGKTEIPSYEDSLNHINTLCDIVEVERVEEKQKKNRGIFYK